MFRFQTILGTLSMLLPVPEVTAAVSRLGLNSTSKSIEICRYSVEFYSIDILWSLLMFVVSYSFFTVACLWCSLGGVCCMFRFLWKAGWKEGRLRPCVIATAFDHCRCSLHISKRRFLGALVLLRFDFKSCCFERPQGEPRIENGFCIAALRQRLLHWTV